MKIIVWWEILGFLDLGNRKLRRYTKKGTYEQEN